MIWMKKRAFWFILIAILSVLFISVIAYAQDYQGEIITKKDIIGKSKKAKTGTYYTCAATKKGYTTALYVPEESEIVPGTAKITRIFTRGCTRIKVNGQDILAANGSAYEKCSNTAPPKKIYSDSEGWSDVISENLLVTLNPGSNSISVLNFPYKFDGKNYKGKSCVEITYEHKPEWVIKSVSIPNEPPCTISRCGEDTRTLKIDEHAVDISAKITGIVGIKKTDVYVNNMQEPVYSSPENTIKKGFQKVDPGFDIILNQGTNRIKVKNDLVCTKRSDGNSCVNITYRYRIPAIAKNKGCSLFDPDGNLLWNMTAVSSIKECIDKCIESGDIDEKCRHSGDYKILIEIPQYLYQGSSICDSIDECDKITDKSIVEYKFSMCNEDIFPEMTGEIGEDEKFICNGKEWLNAGQNNHKIISVNVEGINYDFVSNRKTWTKCDFPGKKVPVGTGSDEDDVKKAAKFICYKLGNNLFFAECCGDSLSSCQTQNEYPKAKTKGSATTAIEDFHDSLTGTKILEYYDQSFNDYFIYFSPEGDEAEKTDMEITDWSDYTALDFFIKFTNTFSQNIALHDGSDRLLLDVKITDYALNSPELNKWLHISIPLSLLGAEENKDDIAKISFYFNSPAIETNKIEIDRIFLVPTDISSLKYCTGASRKPGSVDNLWLDDLDNNKKGSYGEKAGESACNAIPSYAWTGEKCCGDDNYAKNEYYADAEAGCWRGNLLSNKTMPSATNIIVKINNAEKSFSCSNIECVFPFTGNPPFTVSKVSNDELYILSNSVETPITASGSIVQDPNAVIVSKNTKQQAMSADAKLYGCKMDNLLLQKLPSGTVDNSLSLCTIKNGFTCSNSLGWTNITSGSALGFQRDTLKPTPLDSGIISNDCCPASSCWNATECTATQHELPTVKSDINGKSYRCINGDWKKAITKYDWKGKTPAYCPYEDQCLVDIYGDPKNNGNSSSYSNMSAMICSEVDGNLLCSNASQVSHGFNPQCINAHQYVDEHYCGDGNWTSRTKLVAEKILKSLKTGSEDFTLYCDNYLNALNKYDYGNAEKVVKGAFKGTLVKVQTCSETPRYSIPCVNNFCILNFIDGADGKQKIVFGTSLNKPIDYNIEGSSFLTEIFGKSSSNYCDSLINSKQDYAKCKDNDNSLWYSDLTNSIIYSQDSIALSQQSAWQSVMDSFWNIFSWITGQWKPKNSFDSYIDLSFLSKTKDFNKVYVASSNGKKVYAVMESPEEGKAFITVQYQGFDIPFCDTISQFDMYSPGETLCNQTDSNYYIYSNEPESIWQHLTSKLRIS